MEWFRKKVRMLAAVIAIAGSAAMLTAARSTLEVSSQECNWMENWWFQSEGGENDVFYHAGYLLGEEGIGTQVPTGPGEWVSDDMRATTNYHEHGEQGWLDDPPHANCG